MKHIKLFEQFISEESILSEAESNFKTLLGTSEDESIGRKIRLGGKRDPGQEVWQKVDKRNWMNLKTKKKLNLDKWAKHADEFHMSGKDLQFESKVNVVNEGINNEEGVVFSKKGVKSDSPNWYLKRFASEKVAKKFAKNLEKMIKAMDKEDIQVPDFLQGSVFYDDITVMSGEEFKKKYPGTDRKITSKSKVSGGNSYRQNPWMIIWDHFQDNKELHKHW